MVLEAGGRVSALSGAPLALATGEILASNGRIHEEMTAELAGFC